MKSVKIFSMTLAVCIVISFFALDAVCQQKRKKTRKSRASKSVEMPIEVNFPVSPKISEDVLPKGDTFIIQTTSGDVTVRNFFKDRGKDVTSTGIELLAGQVQIGSSYLLSDYSIYFDWNWKYFAITVQKQPIQKIREQAEQALLEQLDISREDACKLTVHLNVLRGVGKFDGGQDYGLSFCPNGIRYSKAKE